MTTTDRRLAALANGQLGIVTRRDAHAARITDRQLRSRVQSGSLVQTGPHSFRTYGQPDTPIGRLHSLMADLGAPCFASGSTAAALHGFDGYRLCEPFDITLLRNRNMRRIGHRIHTTVRLDLVDRATVQDVPSTSAARTIVDLSRTAEPESLRVALDSALRDRLLTERALHRRIVDLRSSGRYGIPKLLSVIEGNEAVSGAHSWLEREFLRLVSNAGLPTPETQRVLARAGDHLVRVDFFFAGTPIVVEVHGYRYHRTAAQMTRDAERTNALLRRGLIPYRFTYGQIVGEPQSVVADVGAALDSAGAA